jgi:DNA-binding MarR family transcriptional regulator
MGSNARAITQLFATASLGAPENAIGFVLWRVVHRYLREIDRELLPLDLTHLQFTTLAMTAWLGRAGQAATQSELARFANIHAMQISQVLKRLEGKGMVVRTSSDADVRAKRVDVTAAGLRALRGSLPVVITVQQRLFGDAGKVGGSLLHDLLQVEAGFAVEDFQAADR